MGYTSSRARDIKMTNNFTSPESLMAWKEMEDMYGKIDINSVRENNDHVKVECEQKIRSVKVKIVKSQKLQKPEKVSCA